MGKRIVLADPRGFCAGVDRAILTVRTILKSADTPRADGFAAGLRVAQHVARAAEFKVGLCDFGAVQRAGNHVKAFGRIAAFRRT